jgi:hypothetical protein
MFFWLEDYPFNPEKEVPAKYGRLEGLILVDLSKRDELKRVINLFKGITGT